MAKKKTASNVVTIKTLDQLLLAVDSDWECGKTGVMLTPNMIKWAGKKVELDETEFDEWEKH